MGKADELFKLVEARAERVAELPERERESALAAIHGHHERSGMDVGMTRAAALEMANRFDTGIREVLRLRPGRAPPGETVH